jgi:hypothetical protein
MGLVAFFVVALAGWLLWTGRLQRMTAKDGMMLGVAVVGAVMAAKGKPLIGALPILASLGYTAWRMRGPVRSKPAIRARPDDFAVAEARALLGLTADADADAIRAAHRRLIATVHPDKGGTQALAAKINAARYTLLRHKERNNPHA